MQPGQLYQHITTGAIIKIKDIEYLGTTPYVTYYKMTNNNRVYNEYSKPLYIINQMYKPV